VNPNPGLPLVIAAFLVASCATSRPTSSPTAAASPTLLPPTVMPSPINTPVPPPTTVTTETIATSNLEIAGIWDSFVLYERGYHLFKDDGTLVIAYVYEELTTNPVFSDPSAYWFEGDVFHIEDFCGHGTYHLTLTRQSGQNRTLIFEPIQEPCKQRAIDWKKPMRWVGPGE